MTQTATGSSLRVPLRDGGGAEVGTVELPPAIFDVDPNIPLIHQVVVAQQAARRSGTHLTKTRGQVRGGSAKPYRQKGTGRARQGSIRAPQFAGGGVVHGPVPRSYAQRTPKKMKAGALRGALSDRARRGLVRVVTSLLDADTPSTRSARAALARVSTAERVLVVHGRSEEALVKSLRNVPEVHLLPADQLNTYDVLCAVELVFTKAGYDAFVEQAAGTPAARTDEEATE